MPLNASLVGHTYPPAPPYRVGREKIREFAEAIGASDPAYLDPEVAGAMGYADVIAPPTFAVVLTNSGIAQLVAHSDLGLDFSRVVHGDQRLRHHRPIQAGDVLTSRTTIEQILSRGGSDFLTVRTEITDADGAPVVDGWSKLVVRGE